MEGKRPSNVTNIVKILLGSGMELKIIPEYMWSVYLETPKPVGGNTWLDENSPSTWCGPKVRPHLAFVLHLAYRYLLHRASRLPPVDA